MLTETKSGYSAPVAAARNQPHRPRDRLARWEVARVCTQQIPHGQRVVLRDLRLPDDKPRQVDQGMHEPGVDPPRWELSRGKRCSLDRGHALFASRASLPRSAQVPRAAITRRAVAAPEYCCCPVIKRPSRTAKALKRPPWM